jgi:hypothetical protein
MGEGGSWQHSGLLSTLVLSRTFGFVSYTLLAKNQHD